jgi:hypothetical protein
MPKIIKKVDPSLSNEIIYLQKMIFVFNAILSGWTVKILEHNTFEFTKDSTNQEVNLDTYIKDFVEKNLNINNIPSISKEK